VTEPVTFRYYTVVLNPIQDPFVAPLFAHDKQVELPRHTRIRGTTCQSPNHLKLHKDGCWRRERVHCPARVQRDQLHCSVCSERVGVNRCVLSFSSFGSQIDHILFTNTHEQSCMPAWAAPTPRLPPMWSYVPSASAPLSRCTMKVLEMRIAQLALRTGWC
jgi:hypothetical protein